MNGNVLLVGMRSSIHLHSFLNTMELTLVLFNFFLLSSFLFFIIGLIHFKHKEKLKKIINSYQYFVLTTFIGLFIILVVSISFDSLFVKKDNIDKELIKSIPLIILKENEDKEKNIYIYDNIDENKKNFAYYTKDKELVKRTSKHLPFYMTDKTLYKYEYISKEEFYKQNMNLYCNEIFTKIIIDDTISEPILNTYKYSTKFDNKFLSKIFNRYYFEEEIIINRNNIEYIYKN